MKILLTLFIALSVMLSSPRGAMAEELNCDQFLEGSTPWASCNNYNASVDADKDLKDAYRNLMTVMNKPAWREAKKKLIAAQRAWIIFRDRECEFSQELIGGSNHVNQSECIADMTEKRAEYIKSLYESYK